MTDWNPLDPDFENVFYDLSVWTSDQQAELTASLAQADVPHAWVESELVVPAEYEDILDTLFDRLEKELGIGTLAVEGGVGTISVVSCQRCVMRRVMSSSLRSRRSATE